MSNGVLWTQSRGGRILVIGLLVVAGYSLVVAIVDAAFDDPIIFGRSPNGDAFLTIAVATATFAYALLTYQILRANLAQIEEQRSASRQQIEAIERQARTSAESAQALLAESIRTRRDDHAPAVTVSIADKSRRTDTPGTKEFPEPDFPKYLMREDFDKWTAWISIYFVIRNDGPGSAVLDISPSIPQGELTWLGDATTEEKRTNTKVLPPDTEVGVQWRYQAGAAFWWDQGRRGWLPPPVSDNPWMQEFPFVTYPPSQIVIDRHTFRVELKPFVASDVSLSINQDPLWLNAPLVATSTREYPGLDPRSKDRPLIT
jgi:hypothetical protein